MRTLTKLSWIEAKLFVREPLAMVFTFAFPFFMLVVLAGVFGNEVGTTADDLKAWRGVGPVDYYAPAYVVLVLASIGLIALPMRLATYRERGVLRRFHAAGLSELVVIGSQVVVAVGLVVVGAVAEGPGMTGTPVSPASTRPMAISPTASRMSTAARIGTRQVLTGGSSGGTGLGIESRAWARLAASSSPAPARCRAWSTSAGTPSTTSEGGGPPASNPVRARVRTLVRSATSPVGVTR